MLYPCCGSLHPQSNWSSDIVSRCLGRRLTTSQAKLQLLGKQHQRTGQSQTDGLNSANPAWIQ